MFTYDVTATGPRGFQVSVTGPAPRGTSLISDFGSLHEAEAFADQMRKIDARGEPAAWSDQSTLTGLTSLTGHRERRPAALTSITETGRRRARSRQRRSSV